MAKYRKVSNVVKNLNDRETKTLNKYNSTCYALRKSYNNASQRVLT